jgi:hypothetical protein
MRKKYKLIEKKNYLKGKIDFNKQFCSTNFYYNKTYYSGITLGPRQTDPINRMICLTGALTDTHFSINSKQVEIF